MGVTLIFYFPLVCFGTDLDQNGKSPSISDTSDPTSEITPIRQENAGITQKEIESIRLESKTVIQAVVNAESRKDTTIRTTTGEEKTINIAQALDSLLRSQATAVIDNKLIASKKAMETMFRSLDIVDFMIRLLKLENSTNLLSNVWSDKTFKNGFDRINDVGSIVGILVMVSSQTYSEDKRTDQISIV